MCEMYRNLLKAPIRNDRKPLHDLLPLSQPLRILIDPCDICNFRCGYCFQSYDEEFTGTVMPKSLFQIIVKQLSEFDIPINVVHLFGLGEPMLNPYLPDFVEILKDKGVAKEVAITSNGSRLNQLLSRQLIDAGLDRLSISLNGIKDNHFEKFVGKRIIFDEIYEQIKYFFEIRKQCHLHVKINGEYFSRDEKEHFVELFKNYSDTLNIDHIVNVWSDIQLNECVGGTMYELVNQDDYEQVSCNVCPQMFYELLVHSDGSVSPCCVDYKYKKENLGNVKTQSLKNIWNSDRLLQIRRGALEGNVCYEICKTCTYPMEASTVNLSPYREKLLEKYMV